MRQCGGSLQEEAVLDELIEDLRGAAGSGPYLSRMTSERDAEPVSAQPAKDSLAEANRQQLERDWSLPMSQRLAHLHELCKQITAIAGAAKRR